MWNLDFLQKSFITSTTDQINQMKLWKKCRWWAQLGPIKSCHEPRYKLTFTSIWESCWPHGPWVTIIQQSSNMLTVENIFFIKQQLSNLPIHLLLWFPQKTCIEAGIGHFNLFRNTIVHCGKCRSLRLVWMSLKM